jgi:hypothetical protein
MRLRRASLIALLLLTGCTSGSLIGALPAVPDPSLAANVVIVAPSVSSGVDAGLR